MTTLATLFAGPLRQFAGCWSPSLGPTREALTPGELLAPPMLSEILARYARNFDGARPHAVGLNWASWYFAKTLPVCVGAALCLHRLRLVPDRVWIELDPRSGRPQRLVIDEETLPGDDVDILVWLEAEHLAVFIAQFSDQVGVPAKLLWNAAAFRIRFLAETLARCEDADAGTRGRAQRLLTAMSHRDPAAPAGRLARPVILTPEGEVLRRAVCCLNDQLGTGWERCVICPIKPRKARGQPADETRTHGADHSDKASATTEVGM